MAEEELYEEDMMDSNEQLLESLFEHFNANFGLYLDDGQIVEIVDMIDSSSIPSLESMLTAKHEELDLLYKECFDTEDRFAIKKRIKAIKLLLTPLNVKPTN